MLSPIDAAIKDRVEHMQAHAMACGDAEEMGALMDALANGRMEFGLEPWNPLNNLRQSLKAIPSEMLLRAYMSDGHRISPEAPVKLINKLGLNREFDQIIVLAAARQALRQGTFPVSINISSRNACDPHSLRTLHSLLQEHFGGRIKPNQIIFELLEDDQADDVNGDAMTEMKDLGYKFAIDDQSHEEWDSNRLKNLGSYVDVVKIDRTTVEAMERDVHDESGHLENAAVNDLFERIEMYASQAIVLLEGVRSAGEAIDLKAAYRNVALVQGRDLHAPSVFNQECRHVLDAFRPAGRPLRLAF